MLELPVNERKEMKNRSLIALLIPLSFFCMTVGAQNFGCGTDELHKRLLLTDSSYANNFKLLENSVQAKIIQKHALNGAPGAPINYTIPVVVHVIHLGEAVGTGTNISDAQIQQAINGLNDRFSNTIGSSVNVQISFCLAKRDPYGCSTTGINRVNGSGISNYSTYGIENGCTGGADEDSIKSLSRWPVSDYYNIWVVTEICDGQWGGYAYYPWGGANDGTVIIYNAMYYNNLTLAHELGHGLNLPHTFNGSSGDSICPIDTNCLVNGDHLCDTQPHKQNDCGSSNPCVGSGTWDNSRYNYMSYCFPTQSLARFTPDGKDRMQATMLVTPRASLATSLGCVPHFNATITKTNLACNAICNGSATATPTCGTSPYTYLWSSGATTQTATGLCAGAYVVTITDATGITANFSVTIGATPDIPTGITSNSPACDTVIISRTGIIPNGETWYWQGTSCDSTLALGSASTYKVTTSGTYYIRGYNNLNHCWSSNCASVNVLVTKAPSDPTSNSPQCTNVTLTRIGTPQSGEVWYWQGTSCGTSTTLGSGSSYSATGTGTYYIRARNSSTGCWSAACGSVSVVTGTITSPVNPTSNAPQCGSVTVTRTGSPPSGQTWYWQGTSCGTSNSLGSGTTFTATSSGTYYIRAYSGGCWSPVCGSVTVQVDTFSALVTTPGNPTSNSPQCSTVTITRSGSPPTGETWYWQGTNCGVSTSLGSSTTYSASTTGTYYIRSRNSTTGCWSTDCGSVSVATGTIATPPNPTSNSPKCSSVTITRTGTPPSGQTWYWQGTSCGNNTSLGSGTTYNATGSGTYYIRAYSTIGGCWSPSCGTVSVTVDTVSTSVSTPSNPTSNSPQCNSVTVTRVGSPPTGETWYWQGTNCGTSTAFGIATTYTANATGTYYIRSRNTSTGCWSPACGSTAVVVNSSSIAPTGILVNDSTLCYGDSIYLNVMGGLLGFGAQWKWYFGSCGGNAVGTGSAVANVATLSGKVYVRAEGTCNTTACAYTTLTVNPLLTVNAGSDKLICAGEGVTLGGNPTASGGSSPYTYSWIPNTSLTSNTLGNPIANPTTTTSYLVIVTDSVGCSKSSGVTVTIPTNGGNGNWTWEGNFDTNWFNPCNWDKRCLPNTLSDVFIPGGLLNYPVVAGNIAYCNSITIDVISGASVNINTNGGGVLNISQ